MGDAGSFLKSFRDVSAFECFPSQDWSSQASDSVSFYWVCVTLTFPFLAHSLRGSRVSSLKVKAQFFDNLKSRGRDHSM